MATVTELKAQLAAIEQELIPLRAAMEAAKVKSNEAEAALNAVQYAPGRVTISKLIAARNAAAADPNNAELQQQYQTLQSQWDAQQAEVAPLIAARDAAYAAQAEASAAYYAKDDQAAQIEIEIAKQDPAQASPEANAYLKENGEYPITPNSDPALAQQEQTQEEQDTGYTPLTTPPGTDEYDGIDTQIENNANRLEEPPIVDPEEDPFEAARLQREQDFENTTPTEQDVVTASGGWQGLQGDILRARSAATAQDQANYKQNNDWRVRLSLAPNANYLYKAPQVQGILQPLIATDGILFPYTPSVSVTYAAGYSPTELTHSNYKIWQYTGSSVDNVQITCDFTAQDTFEADYLLAVIHFFRSVTKMFYGQDQDPKPGTPPPLCYLSGLGAFQFDNHPLAITSFNYSLPTDVDYIRAGSTTTLAGVNKNEGNVPNNSSVNPRLTGLMGGGLALPPRYQTTPGGTVEPTYVPTKIQIQISAVPIISRNDISNRFSVKSYATGSLLRGSQNKHPGIW